MGTENGGVYKGGPASLPRLVKLVNSIWTGLCGRDGGHPNRLIQMRICGSSD
jgi:hypothetical protein